MRQRMHDATARDRFATQVLGAFAVTALLLAAIGIYGVLSLAVAQRRRELGIRMALGAEQGGVMAMILGQAMSLAAVGGLIGAVGALIAGRALGSLLYGVTAARPGDVRGVRGGARRGRAGSGDRSSCEGHARASHGRAPLGLSHPERVVIPSGAAQLKSRNP